MVDFPASYVRLPECIHYYLTIIPYPGDSPRIVT